MKTSPTNVEVCDLESLLLGQLQHHLDVICVESAQRVASQQRHLLPRAVPQVLQQGTRFGSLKITWNTETQVGSSCGCLKMCVCVWGVGNIWHTHVISEPPDRLWSLASIFSAADFLAAFLEFPTAVGGKACVMWTPTLSSNAPESAVPVSDRDSSRQLRVNSLLCGGPASIKTVYSGRGHPLCKASSWHESATRDVTQGLHRQGVSRLWDFHTCRTPTELGWLSGSPPLVSDFTGTILSGIQVNLQLRLIPTLKTYQQVCQLQPDWPHTNYILVKKGQKK